MGFPHASPAMPSGFSPPPNAVQSAEKHTRIARKSRQRYQRIRVSVGRQTAGKSRIS